MHLASKCIIGLLMAMSLENSLRAQVEEPLFSNDDMPRLIERRPVHKTSIPFKLSELYLAGGTAFDMTTTVQNLGHPTIAYKADGEILAHYKPIETGWMRFAGNGNTSAIILGNVSMNLGIDMFSRRLYARGGRWRILAFGLNLAKASLNTQAAIHNIRYDAGVDNLVRRETGYKGQIMWSH